MVTGECSMFRSRLCCFLRSSASNSPFVDHYFAAIYCLRKKGFLGLPYRDPTIVNLGDNLDLLFC